LQTNFHFNLFALGKSIPENQEGGFIFASEKMENEDAVIVFTSIEALSYLIESAKLPQQEYIRDEIFGYAQPFKKSLWNDP
jgi:hypothetical protein